MERFGCACANSRLMLLDRHLREWLPAVRETRERYGLAETRGARERRGITRRLRVPCKISCAPCRNLGKSDAGRRRAGVSYWLMSVPMLWAASKVKSCAKRP